MPIEDQYLLELDPADLTLPGAPITPERWKAEVRRVLAKVERTKVGNMLLRSIPRHLHWVRIQPYWNSPTRVLPPSARGHLTNPCNAETIPIRVHNPLNGRTYRSALRISPERYAPGSTCAKRRGALIDDHEIFFHELVHAFRHVSETWGNTDFLQGGLREHKDGEEFIAILVTNIYASCNGKTVLRGAHRGRGALPDEFEDSFRFFEMSEQTYKLVEQFYAANKELCDLLKSIKAPFNPIWAYFHDARKAKRLSESARAKDRDARADSLTMLEKVLWLAPSQNFEKLMRP